mmetsp:Transcript_826/g.3452  ORF Transcript_826/g.3452 Transcript_826/m.3452 type:complete len:247 (+) Transcript_826:1408-2148(+)
MCGLTHRTLLGHRTLKTFQVHRDTSFSGDIRGDVEREAIRIVQRKGILTAQPRLCLLRRLDELSEHLFATTECLLEAQFLALELGENARRVLSDLRIATFRHGNRDFGDGRRERARPFFGLDPEQTPVSHNSAKQSSNDVPTSDVRGENAVGNHVTHRSRVVADDFELLLLHVVARVVIDPSHRRRFINDGHYQICFVIVRHALKNLRHALETHAGVDILILQRRHAAVGVAIEFHEDQVVKLDES